MLTSTNNMDTGWNNVTFRGGQQNKETKQILPTRDWRVLIHMIDHGDVKCNEKRHMMWGATRNVIYDVSCNVKRHMRDKQRHGQWVTSYDCAFCRQNKLLQRKRASQSPRHMHEIYIYIWERETERGLLTHAEVQIKQQNAKRADCVINTSKHCSSPDKTGIHIQTKGLAHENTTENTTTQFVHLSETSSTSGLQHGWRATRHRTTKTTDC